MSESTKNPFTQAMAPAKAAAEDFARMFSELKLPSLPDTEALLNAHRRNFEAFTAANRIAQEGAQALARRYMEIAQQSMTELSDNIRSLATSEPPQAKLARQAELLKAAYERGLANTRELGDLSQRSTGEAVAVLNRRFSEAMDEVKGLLEKAKHT